MCGIVGCWSASPVDQRHFADALRLLHPRGPDGNGTAFFEDRRLALGHTRLAIQDVSSAGRQPMTSRCGRATITYNGELYNGDELRRQLESRGYVFRGRSDTEVLLNAYLEHGTAVLERLNGIFAFALFDRRERVLFLARDQLGVKPLYYCAANGFRFASDIKALLAFPQVERSPDVVALKQYVALLWAPGERTPLSSVRKLRPGCAMLVRDGVPTRHWAYWNLPEYDPREQRPAELAEELRSTVLSAVKRQLVSDVPVGSFLSGGVDSTFVAAAGRRALPDLRCFTIAQAGGAESGTVDDLPYARRAADALGLPLREVAVDPVAAAGDLDLMVRALGEPLADPACLNVLYISRAAREDGIKVLLSGAGGDDLFSGYRRHTLLHLSDRLPPLGVLGRCAAILERYGASPKARKLTKALRILTRTGAGQLLESFLWTPLACLDRLFLDMSGQPEVFQPLLEVLEQSEGKPRLERCLMLEKAFFLPDHNLSYTDKMGMACGVEIRVPLIDVEVCALAARVPARLKHRGRQPKWILKEAARGLVPPEVLARRKSGFGAPLRRWMQSELAELTGDMLGPRSIRNRGLFQPAAVAALRDAHARGAGDASYSLFALLCIELWCRNFLDGAALEPAAPPPAGPTPERMAA